MWFLAQAPDQALDWAEKAKHLGFSGICLLAAVIALFVAYWQFNLRLNSEKEKAELERSYRSDLDARAKQEKLDAEKRLAEAKSDAERHAKKHEDLLRERMAAEKESDATLAHTVRVIEAITKVMDRVDRKLDKLEG